MRIPSASRVLSAPFRAASEATFGLSLKAANLVAGGKNPFPQSVSWNYGIPNLMRALLGEQVKGKSYDFQARAGQVWKNSVVGIALNWMQRTYPEAPLCVEKMRKGRWEVSFEHEVLDLLEAPNPFWTSDELWCAILLSWIAVGNAYLVKIRSKSGQVVELWWVPWWMMEPRWSGNEYITHYDYTVNGTIYRVEIEDVVHLRNGVNPESTRKGMSDLQAGHREIAGDNEAVTYHAAILFNMGVPGIVFVPKAAKDSVKALDPEEKQSFLADFKAKFRGERAGEPLVLTQAFDIHTPGFSPENLALDKLIKFYESRIAGALGIPAVILGLIVGLETATAKASHGESLKQAYRSCIRPLHRKINLQLTRQLVRDFDNPKRVRLARDYSEIPECQEDQQALYDRQTKALGNRPWISVNEARSKAKLPALEDPKYDDIAETALPSPTDGSDAAKSGNDPEGKPSD